MKGKIFNALAKSKIATSAKRPEVMLGAGIGLCLFGTVMACKATLEIDDILDEAAECNKRIEDGAALNLESYPIEAQNRDRLRVKARTCIGLVKLYSPAIGVMGLGIASILGSYNIMSNRCLALASTCTALSDGFKFYRSNVIEELGEDADKRFRYGIKQVEKDIPVMNKKGEDTGKTKTVTANEVPDDILRNLSPYAKYFDETCKDWSQVPGNNLFFLRSQQKIANDLLQSQGHLFLNEVYDLLGLERTREGAIVGWIFGGGYDDYVDFGIYELKNAANRRFVNGLEDIILLDFNVDGIIYDKL